MRVRPAVGPIPRTVVMQPHTLCPLDCTYCYLPDRRKNLRMTVETAQAVAQEVNRWYTRAPQEGFCMLWHGSEPLALGVEHLAKLIEPFNPGVTHSVQTAGIHIDDAWCDYFQQIGMRVGISLDGPRGMNTRRKLLGGQETWQRTVDGCALLRARGIAFTAICVVTDPDPADARTLLDFFTELGTGSLGINVEETEGINRAPRQHCGRITEFWQTLFDEAGNYRMSVREVNRVTDYLATRGRDAARVLIDPLPTVSYKGDVTMIAPELASFTDPHYGTFASGNVHDTPLSEIVLKARGVPWIRDYLAGVANCATRCAIFDFCGGGHASNKHFEGVGLTGTVTEHCTSTRMALLAGALDSLH